MAQPKEASEFNREEDTYRVKSTRAKYCGLGLDISGGLLKALPPVAITNLAAILVLNQWLDKAAADEVSDIERFIDIAETTLFFFAVVFAAVAIMAWSLTPRLVKNTRHAEWSDIKVRAIKADAISALADYKGDMPRVMVCTLRIAGLDDSGKLNLDWVRPNWRTHTKVPEKMRRNLEDLYPDLVMRMDELTKSMNSFIGSFNAYSTAFQKANNEHTASTAGGPSHENGSKPGPVDDHTKSKIIGSYLWYSGMFKSMLESDVEKSDDIQDPMSKGSLKEFMRNDPLRTNSTLDSQIYPKLVGLAIKAKNDWQEALDEYMRIISIIDEIQRRRT